MRNALLMAACLASPLASAEEQISAPAPAVRVALAGGEAASRRIVGDKNDSPDCQAEMDPQSLRELVRTEARQAGIDEKLALAILDQESSDGVNLNSPKGARGPMMLMPRTAAQYGVKDICNPVENVHGSMLFLKDLTAQFQGNMMLVAAGYNAGSERVFQAKGVPSNSETVRYVASVTNRYYGLADVSARRARQKPPKRSDPPDPPDVETSRVEKSRSASDQRWIGGSVLYVSSNDEGNDK